MPKARRKSGVRRALRADPVLGAKPRSLAKAKAQDLLRGGDGDGDGGDTKQQQQQQQQQTAAPARRNAAPAGVEAARKRRESKREKFLDKLRESKREIEVVKAVRSHGEALGDVGSLSDALTQTLKELEAARGQQKGGKKKQGRQQQQQDARKRLRNKARKQIQLAEVSLFKQVISHPSMAQDPVGAVQQHLRRQLEHEDAQ